MTGNSMTEEELGRALISARAEADGELLKLREVLRDMDISNVTALLIRDIAGVPENLVESFMENPEPLLGHMGASGERISAMYVKYHVAVLIDLLEVYRARLDELEKLEG